MLLFVVVVCCCCLLLLLLLMMLVFLHRLILLYTRISVVMIKMFESQFYWLLLSLHSRPRVLKITSIFNYQKTIWIKSLTEFPFCLKLSQTNYWDERMNEREFIIRLANTVVPNLGSISSTFHACAFFVRKWIVQLFSIYKPKTQLCNFWRQKFVRKTMPVERWWNWTPGVRVPPGIRERSLGVRQILLTLKLLFNIAFFAYN